MSEEDPSDTASIARISKLQRMGQALWYAYDEWCYPMLEQGVNQIRVKFNPLRIDRVVTASKRNNARPGDGEPVRFHPVFDKECNIFPPAHVRISGYISISTIESLARLLGEVIPDRFTSSIDVSGSFNLKTRCTSYRGTCGGKLYWSE